LTKIEGISTDIYNIKEIDLELMDDFDAIVIGGPNHMGRPTGTMKNFVNKLSKFVLKSKKIAIFGTYAGKERTEDRTVRKLEMIAKNKLSNFDIIQPTLSIRVKKIRGSVIKNELPKCLEFGNKIGLHLIEK